MTEDEMDRRHQRQLALMRAMGEVNRMETRRNIMIAVALILFIAAILLGASQ